MKIAASEKSKRTTNPIRNIVDKLDPPKNHPLPFLNLALGDPTLHGNLECPDELKDTISKLLVDGTANGYAQSIGIHSARQAIADYSSTKDQVITADDVIIASGCSGAIDLVLTGLLNEGDNILVPNPSFPLYQVIAQSLGGSVKRYGLKPETGWECDLESMDSIIDERTKAIIINNPSNPCGSNFSAEHLRGIAEIARKHKLPIVADEIYGRCVFNGVFTPMFSCSGDVPVISVGGLAKEFIVPGWRVGWLVFYDGGTDALADVRVGIRSLTQIVLGASTLIQHAIPRILKPTPDSPAAANLTAFSTRYMGILRSNVQLCLDLTANCRELSVIEPAGAMYMMIQIHSELLEAELDNDATFSQRLLQEENVFVLPGQCFGVKHFVRLVICAPPEILTAAINRMKNFCEKHRRKALKRDRKTTGGIEIETSVNVSEEVAKIEGVVSAKKAKRK